MRIAQLAPLIESVPPAGYGGSELVVSLLTEELAKRGHTVTLFASGDSVTKAELIASVPTSLRQSLLTEAQLASHEMRTLFALERMLDRFDIIHNHMGHLALPFLRNVGKASITTNHDLVSDRCEETYRNCRMLPYVAISNSYRKATHLADLNFIATVHNGIDLESFTFDCLTKRKYLLFLGRICAEKGAAEAISIAKRIGLPIILAGKVDKSDREYYEEQIRPLLGESEVEYVGEVTRQEKRELYRSAIATLCPIKFEEPFGLVLVESLASGTPVMALRRGAVPEVITDGTTGVVADTVDELVRRFGEISHLKRHDCRRRAELLFSKERMTSQYENIYSQVLAMKAGTGDRQVGSEHGMAAFKSS